MDWAAARIYRRGDPAPPSGNYPEAPALVIHEPGRSPSAKPGDSEIERVRIRTVHLCTEVGVVQMLIAVPQRHRLALKVEEVHSTAEVHGVHQMRSFG